MNVLNRIQAALCILLPLYCLVSSAQPAANTQGGQQGKIVVMPGQVVPGSTGPKPLIIGVDTFTPPFSMRGGRGELFGFDISMMNSLCKIMNRTCQFKPMKWINLLPSILNNQIDFAVSSITITPERIKEINFSLPYALSYSRFLTTADRVITEPFSFAQLESKKIGVQAGTIYATQISNIGLINPVIKTYENDPAALQALTNKEVDYILLDNPTALYWAANSSGVFKVLGKPYAYGYGIGIAVKKSDASLIPELNKALLHYQSSDDYKQNYARFLESF